MSAEPRRAALSRREAAVRFLRLATSGRVREAYDDHVRADFVHHNPYFGPGAAPLMAGMEENYAQHPDKVIAVQRTVEHGDFVAVHSRVRSAPEIPGAAVVHIFRFEGERIAELWDVAQPVVEKSPNKLGMF